MVADAKKSRGKKPQPDKAKPTKKPQHWDEVAEASWESFPASDPPPWTASGPGQPAKKSEDEK